jgi:hypothetical protein
MYLEVLVGHEEKKSLKANRRWEDNIRIHVKEAACEDTDQILLILARGR